MKEIKCAQGSPEWLRARLGIPSASNCHRFVTPVEFELAKGRRSYQIELLTELILGMPLDTAVTPAMMHGNDFEAKAVAAYELEMGVDTEMCGFCVTDDGRAGASPDRFVGDYALLETKCPFKPEVHVGYLVSPDSLEKEHRPQTQMQLLVCGRKYTDLISYFPGLPMVRVRVTPHEEFQKKLAANLKLFLDELDARVSIARDRGWIKERKEQKPYSGPDFLTDADAEAILAAQREQR